MKRVAGILAVVLTAFCTTAAHCGGGGAVSLTDALSLPDGASASVVGVLVREVHLDGSFTVRESWSDAFTLSVIPTEPVEISPLQTVDVSGIIQISINGKRRLNASSVKVYTDSTGSTIITPMPVRTERAQSCRGSGRMMHNPLQHWRQAG